MLKKLLGLGVLAGAALTLTGCVGYGAPVSPPIGWIYSSYKAPLDFDQEMSPVGTREGRAEAMSILGLVSMGDCSIKTAAQDGGITTLYGADYEYFNILGVIQRFTVIAHGE